MKKVLFVLFVCCLPLMSFCQSKKVLNEIITRLRYDSTYLQSTLNERDYEIGSLRKKIELLKNDLTKKINNNEKLVVELDVLKKEIVKYSYVTKSQKIKIENLDSIIKLYSDSLNLCRSIDSMFLAINKLYKTEFNDNNEFYEQNLDLSNNSFSKDYKKVGGWGGLTFLKFQKYPVPFKGQDIKSWLSKFEVSSESNIVYDYDVDPEHWKGVSSYLYTCYKNGIIIHKFSSYEGIYIQVEMPFISVDDAKYIFERFNLESLAPGCLQDFEIHRGLSYRHKPGTYTVSVFFGNGC